MQRIDPEKFKAVREALHPIAIGDQGEDGLPDDIAVASITDLAEMFDSSVNRLLTPEEFQAGLPLGRKAGVALLPGNISLELEFAKPVRQGPFPPHPGWYARRNVLTLSKDQMSEREEPLKRSVSIWTEESTTPWLAISEEERIANIHRTQAASFSYEAFVGVPLNVPILAVLGLPFNHYDAANIRVSVSEDKLPKPDERLGFAVGVLLLAEMHPEQFEPRPRQSN